MVPTDWIIKLMTASLAFSEWTIYYAQKVVEAWIACVNVFSEKNYVIFDGSSNTYDMNTVNIWATGSATPRWQYNASKKEFIKWHHTQTVKTSKLPFLSMELVTAASNVHYDLTDFIEKIRIRYEGAEEIIPSVDEILSAWSVDSHIVPNPSTLRVRVITEMGDTEEYTLDGVKLEASTDSDTEDSECPEPPPEEPEVEGATEVTE